MHKFRCLECGKSSPERFEWNRCCSPECLETYDARYVEDRARRHHYAVVERQRLEAEWGHEQRARRSVRPVVDRYFGLG